MELQIVVSKESSVQGAINLKRFIDSASIDGLEKSEVDRSFSNQGEMGTGNLLGSITTLIQAAEKPLVELIKCLQKYVDNYRTTVIIPTTNGNIELKHGRGMTPEQLQELVVAIQKNNNNISKSG